MMPSSRLARLFARYVAFAQRRTGTLLIGLLLLAAGAGALALRLELRTDWAELLPDNHPAVVALRRISGKQKASTNLVLLVESPDAGANRRFADALRGPLEKMVPQVFSEVQWHADTEEPDYAAKWKWLYADPKDLAHAEELLDRLIARRGAPGIVDLDDDDPEAELKALRKRLEQKLPARPRDDHWVAEENGRHFLGVMLWRRGDGVGTLGDDETLRATQDLVERIGPRGFHPQMKVRYTGAIAMAISQRNSFRDDIAISAGLCGSLVLLVIWLYFRRIALLPVIGAPAVLGLLLALALASLTIHQLNITTGFLTSIIIGNGINSPIILLARYGEERRRGAAVPEALATAMASTVLATGTAMIAASISYGSLLATSFRGFSQFGLIGGSGMLLVWLASFVLVPPMVIFGERWKPGLLTPRANLLRRPFAAIGRLGERRPKLLLAATALALAGAIVPLSRWLRDPLEWNFGNLRNRETQADKDWGTMYRLGMGDVGAGHIGTDAVLLVDEPSQADAVAEALWRQDEKLGKEHVLRAVRTVNTTFPETVTPTLPHDQAAKLETLARIRSKIDKHLDLMSDDERAEAQNFRPPDYLRPLTPDDLPRQRREAFTEVGGVRGRLIGIDADPSNYSDWNGHDLLRLARSLRVEALGRTWVAAATGTVFAGMIETISRDGPLVSWLALGGVLALIVVAFGIRRAAPVIASLLIGMAWLGGAVALLGLKLNFVNFVAVPITLGIGADYAANIWARLRLDGVERLVDAVADTGSAVALCSATTVIGYSSLLLAGNRALQSFGMVADLGEATCLLAALVALPALVRVTLGGRAAAPERKVAAG